MIRKNTHHIARPIRALLMFVVFLTNHFLSAQNKPISFRFTLSASSNTSAGIFRPDSTLVRTLWNNVRYPAGSHTQYWDRKDDDGKLVSDSNFVVRVVSNNVTYKWDGAIIGNTSDSVTGLKKHRYFTRPNSMAIYGTQAYYTVGYIEGFTSCYKFSLSAPQNKIGILYNTNHDIDMEGSFTATDGTRVYWAGYDPYNTDITFTYATTVAADKEVMFSSGASVAVTYGRTYPSAIDLYTNNAASRPSGLAVQKNGNYLFISHQGLDELHVLDKTTGALVQTISINDPRQLCVDMNDNLWMIYDANTVEKFTVNTNGTISSASLTISGLSEPLALAVSPNNYMIVVADGGSSQQIKAFNNNNGNTVWTLGLAGGYATDPSVTNTKFCFSHQNTNLKGSFIAFQSDSSFWIGDPGNERVQHFGASRNYINNIMSLPKSYCVQADRNDPTRVFNEYLEFKIDYSKTLAVGNGSWTLVKNWRCGVPANYYLEEKNNILRDVITLSNGRTYAAMEDLSNPGFRTPEIVELPSSGHMRFTGIQLEAFENFIIDLDGTLRTLTGDGSIGKTAEWTSRRLTGFDNNNNPIWANPVSIAKTPKVVLEDPMCDGPSFPAKTSSDVLVVFNPWQINNIGKGSGYHLGAVKKGSTNKWLWMTSKATAKNYSGPMPSDGAFDCGNSVQYPGGHVYAVDRNIFWNYRGEFWKNSQTNIWNHYYDNGLMIGQFGVTTPDGRPGNFEAFAMGAGNVFNATIVKLDNQYYIYHNDESEHGGVHRWKIDGLNTIREEIILIKPIRFQKGGLRGYYYDKKDLDPFYMVHSRIDQNIHLQKIPDQISDSNFYSVRWVGSIQSQSEKKTYKLICQTNAGIRLWLNGELLIDSWQNTLNKEFSTKSIDFIAYQFYEITIETNGGKLQFLWSEDNQTPKKVPSDCLFPAAYNEMEYGINMMQGLKSKSIPETGIYGWAFDHVNTDSSGEPQIWITRSGFKSYDHKNPDLFLQLQKSVNIYTAKRHIAPQNTCVNNWKIKGSINFEDNMPNSDTNHGFRLDVTDRNGRVITRITHEIVYDNNNINYTQIKCNGEAIVNLPYNQLVAILNKPKPFEIEVTKEGVIFRYADYIPIFCSIFDASSQWKEVSELRFRFIGDNYYNRTVTIEKLRFFGSFQNKITITGNEINCPGTAVELSAGAGKSFLWNTGAKTQKISVTKIGEYSVKTVDSGNCVAESKTITLEYFTAPLPQMVLTGKKLISNYKEGNQWFLNGEALSDHSDTLKLETVGLYWLMVTDKNNCVGLSNKLLVNELKINSENLSETYFLSPNPNHGKFSIQGDDLSSGEVIVFDQNGRRLYQTNDLQMAIDLSYLNSGTYFLHLKTALKSQFIKLIIL